MTPASSSPNTPAPGYSPAPVTFTSNFYPGLTTAPFPGETILRNGFSTGAVITAADINERPTMIWNGFGTVINAPEIAPGYPPQVRPISPTHSCRRPACAAHSGCR